MDLNSVKTDYNLENDGVWVPLDETSKLLIARLGNEAYKKLMTKKLRPYRNMLRNNTMPDETMDKIFIEVLAETVLLGWDNLMEDGQVIKFSVEKAKELLTKYKDFRDIVVGFAQDMAIFQRHELEEAGKNFETSSAGT